MFCVIQTDSFVAAARHLRLTEAEVHAIVLKISETPEIGDLIEGTGGARKWRVPMRNRGKSGGYRVISYFAGYDIPVFLLEIFAKGEKINLTKSERNELRSILGGIAEDYRASVKERVANLTETVP